MKRSRLDWMLVYFGFKEDHGTPVTGPEPLWQRLLLLLVVVVAYVGLVVLWGWDVLVIGFLAVAVTTLIERFQRRRNRTGS